MLIGQLHYKLGEKYKINSIDLKLISTNIHKGKYYRSEKYSKMVLFNKVYEFKCFLWFKNDTLTCLEYFFNTEDFELFINSINNDLPKGFKLEKDPLNSIEMYDCYLDGYCISLNKYFDYFKLIIWQTNV